MLGDTRKRVAAFLLSAAVLSALGYLTQSAGTPHRALWPYLILALIFLLGLLLLAFPQVVSVLSSGWRGGTLRFSTWLGPHPNSTKPAASHVSARWRFANTPSEVSPLADIGYESFSHPSYLRQYQNTPPTVRVGAFVACSPLQDKKPTEAELRRRFLALLQDMPIMSLISLLTSAGSATWQLSQPGRGRFNLEADLLRPSKTPAASAVLRLPDASREGAELIVHVDLPVSNDVPAKAKADRWYERFTAALAVPAELAGFVRDLELTTVGDPAMKFAIQIQARPAAAGGMEEIVETVLHTKVSPATHSSPFDGWAVADSDGSTARDISAHFLENLYKAAGWKLNELVVYPQLND